MSGHVVSDMQTRAEGEMYIIVYKVYSYKKLFTSNNISNCIGKSKENYAHQENFIFVTSTLCASGEFHICNQHTMRMHQENFIFVTSTSPNID